mmetsp:Transcript_18687/g.53532  ORF Transcript_18687/g.53532 Transcript_18687/m.53532 type:complete len:1121 (-) Transcript_18687:563-3925(-)
MYIGSTGVTGYHHLVWEVVDNAVDEALAGHCNHIHINLHTDGSVSVSDNGRGIPCDIHRQTGRSALETVMTVLHAGGKFGNAPPDEQMLDETAAAGAKPGKGKGGKGKGKKGGSQQQRVTSGYKVSGGLHGVGVSVVNALSQWLDVQVNRGGHSYSMGFERGKVTTPLQAQASPSPSHATHTSGTTVRFLPDPSIFKEAHLVFDYDRLKGRCDELTYLNPGLTITLRDFRDPLYVASRLKRGQGEPADGDADEEPAAGDEGMATAGGEKGADGGVGVGVGDDCGLGTGIEDDEQMWVKSVAVKMANEAADGLFGISTPRRAEPEREHEGEPEGGASCSTSEAAVALEVHIDQPREMARDDGKHQEPDESPGGGKRSHRQPSDDNAATAASSAAEQADRAIPIAFPVTLPKEAVPSLSLIRTSTFSKYLRGHYKGQRSFTEVCRSILGAGKGQADSWKKSRRRESEKPAVVSDGGDDVEGGDQLMEEESRESGEVSWGVISRYLAAAGGITWVISITVALILERASYVGSDIWLAHWTREDPIASDVNIYLAIYCAIFASNAVVVFIRTSLFALFTIRASRHMFRKLLQSCLRCPQSFFDTTPIGRIVNRFSYDTETADVTLVTKMIPFVASLFWLTAGVLVLLVVLWPWMLLVMAPMAFFYWQLLQYSRSSIRDLQRLDSVSRSPLQSHVAESLDGLQCLRAYGCGERFAVRCDEHTDNNTRAVFCFNSANRWLGVRVESIGAIISLGAAVLIWIVREDLTGGLVGLVLVWVLNLSVSTNYLCIYTPQFEAAMTSVERIDEYSQLPEEPCYNQPTDKTTTAPTGWPSNGAIEFRGTCLRYRPGLPRALRGLWLSIEGGERVALVGRTGAGKSSVAVALFRLVEPWSELGEGSGILVDGVDIGTLRREDVRGRHGGICIITQDPIIFSGTVRSNLDPFDQHSDEDVWRALSRARLDKLVRAHTAMLAMPVQEGGSNFSLGERQLLCLARALLCRPKVLVMDEATASVDRATDDFVQHTVRAAFRDCTLLTIAHRLQTIADYDKVVVMDAGRVVEVGAPYDLLTAPREHEFNKRPGSFLRLVQSCGPHVAMQILTTAAEAKLLRERRWGDHHSGTKGHFLTS